MALEPKSVAASIIYALFLLAVTGSAHGNSSLETASYSTYSGDYNGDGHIDVLLKAERTVVIIAADIVFPVIAKRGVDIFLESLGSSDYQLTVNPNSAILDDPIWVESTYSLLFGDTTGDGLPEMLLRPDDSSDPAFLLSFDVSLGVPTLIQTISPGYLGSDFGDAAVEIELLDVNSDGQADLVFRQNGSIIDAYVADNLGAFHPQDNDQFVMVAIWNDFGALLDNSNIPGAVQYIYGENRDVYAEILGALGPDLPQLTSLWSNFRPRVVKEDYAEFTFIQSANGLQRLQTVMFVLDEDGSWRIHSF